MPDTKHVKLEFDPDTYEVIREAAYLARTPIRRWCMELVARTAREKAPTCPVTSPATSASTTTAVPSKAAGSP